MSNKKTQIELMNELAELVEQLGWVIGIPDGDEKVPGLVIGELSYVEEVVEAYYGPGFSVFEKDEHGELVEKAPTKKVQVH